MVRIDVASLASVVCEEGSVLLCREWAVSICLLRTGGDIPAYLFIAERPDREHLENWQTFTDRGFLFFLLHYILLTLYCKRK